MGEECYDLLTCYGMLCKIPFKATGKSALHVYLAYAELRARLCLMQIAVVTFSSDTSRIVPILCANCQIGTSQWELVSFILPPVLLLYKKLPCGHCEGKVCVFPFMLFVRMQTH